MPANQAKLWSMLTPPALPDIKLPHAPLAVEQARWVESMSSYQNMSDHLSTQPMVGIDTEFVRERTFYPSPGLVQLSDGQSVWLADVVKLDDHVPLKALLDQSHATKVLHSVGEDLELLSLLTSSYPVPLLDTQVAAAFLGFPAQIRYEHLIERVFGVELPGGQARSNWCQRPLSASLLAYAAQDVIYLPMLAQVLCEELDRQDRLIWVHEDCARLIEQKKKALHYPPLLRVKGAGRLSKIAMAYVASLAKWRDQEAKARNLPRSFVLKDEMLLDLASHAERLGTHKAISQLRGALKRFWEPCLEALEATKPDDFEIPQALIALTSDQKQTLKRWQVSIGELATSLNIEPSLIASKKELTRLLQGDSPGWLFGWRGPLVFDQLGLKSIAQ